MMVGNTRFELSSASPDSTYTGYSQRGNHSGPGSDRSGSFREGSDGRIFNSGKVSSRGSGSSAGDTPSLSQCINLELIPMVDQKVMRSGDLKRVLGASAGGTSGDSIIAGSHLKNSPPVEDLKQYRAQVHDTCIQASGRSKVMDERLHKLRQYMESPSSKKQQRGELLTNERSGGSNLKIGNQIHRSPSDVVSQKMEDRPKTVILNKRVRTSVADTRMEGRGNGLSRQPLMMPKERDTNNADTDITEEKIRRLPAGGESWDKTMKRKRSVGAVSSRPIDGEGEPKRTSYHKPSNEPGLHSSDPQSFRAGSNNGAGGISKMDGPLSLSSSNARATLKMEQDKPTFPREHPTGLNKERLLSKGSIKLSNREENHVVCSSPIIKGKASRAPRSGATMATNSSNLTRVPGTFESWEVPQSMNKTPLVGTNNRKRPMTAGSSSPPITQWGGQRPQKMSRTRRANVVSPVSNHDEMQTPSESCSPDFGARLANSSLISKGSVGGTQNLKAKLDTVSSPARFSESEESGAGETKLKEKGVGNGEVDGKAAQNGSNPAMLLKKNKFIVKEQIGDFRRQGRTGRGSSVSRASISPVREKMDNITTAKPIRSIRSGSEKNGSKSGRPLKKASDRKGFSRLGHIVSGGSPDCTGESDDDREELLAAANLAYNSSVLACSSSFWKKFEVLFSSISSEGKSFLLQQLKLSEDMHENLSQTLNDGSNLQGDCMHEEISLSGTNSEERSRSTQYKSESKDLASSIESSDQFKGSSMSGVPDSGRKFPHVPLYQRVLSALIIEDNVDEFDENGWDRCMSSQNALLDSPDDAYDAWFRIDGENKVRDRMELEYESANGFQSQNNGAANQFISSNANDLSGRKSIDQASPYNGEFMHGENGYLHSEVQVLGGLSGCDSDGAQSHGNSSNDFEYEQLSLQDKLLLELQSIGIYPETVPDLQDKEDEVINEEIIQLKSGLYQQVGKKKTRLDKIYEAIQGGKDVEGPDLEQVAMNKLVEISYKKLLATRGNLAIKNGMAKVPRQVALGFARRTIVKCKKFEDSGASCFNEPGLREVIFAPPPHIEDAEPLDGVSAATANHPSRNNGDRGDMLEASGHQSDQAFAKNGPILNRGKKKEVLLDDVGGAANRMTCLGNSLLGGARGKRSERDASFRNSIAKAGRSSLGNPKVERKTRPKTKQRTAQLSSTSGSGFINNLGETGHPTYPSSGGSGDRKREIGLISPSSGPDMSKEMKESIDNSTMPLNDIDPMEELGEPQDVNSWFITEDDFVQDHDSMGLEVPMDNIEDLIIF